MRKRSELLFSLILVPIDYLALVAAFVAAYLVRVRLQDKPVAHPIAGHTYLQFAFLVMPVWIFIFALTGLYAQSSLRGRLQEMGRVFVAVSGGVMFTILLDFWHNQPLFPSKSVPVYAYGFGLLFVLAGRMIVRAIQRGLFRSGIGVHQALLVGSGQLARRIADDLSHPGSGYHLLGCIDNARGAARRLPWLEIYPSLATALARLKDNPVDEIIQADAELPEAEVLELIRYAANHHITYRFVPNQVGLYATNSVVTSLAGIPTVEIKLTPLDGWGRIFKRVADFVGSAIGLVVLSPLFLAVAVAIKLRDPGPVFYRQRRISRAGHDVYIFKFRSMGSKYSRENAIISFRQMGREDLVKEFELTHKVKDDPRITRLGRWLRATSIDELPQLVNVLKGEMSLVGPRPILFEELKDYGDQGSSYLALKPGLTGLWQISGRNDISFEERVKLDIYYVEHWSPLLDLKIALKTVLVVFRGRGAY